MISPPKGVDAYTALPPSFVLSQHAVRKRHMQGVGAGTADVHGVRACVQLVICFGTSHKATHRSRRRSGCLTVARSAKGGWRARPRRSDLLIRSWIRC